MIWRQTKLREAIEKTNSRLSKNKKRKTKLCENSCQLMQSVPSKLLQIENPNSLKINWPSSAKRRKKQKHAVKKKCKSRRLSD